MVKTSNIQVYTINNSQGFPNTLVHFVSAVIDRSKLGQHTENTMPVFVVVFFFFTSITA